MTVQLRSLRVDARLDGSAQYASGAGQVMDANKAMAASFAVTDAAMTKLPAGMTRLSRELIPFYKEEAKFIGMLDRINRAMGEGMDTNRAVVMLENLQTQFGRTVTASDAAALKLRSIAQVVDELGKKAVIADRFAASLAAIERMGDAQRQINSLTGVDYSVDLTARQNAIDTYTAEIERLGQKYDPVQAAAAKFKAEVNELERGMTLGAFGAGVYSKKMAEAQAALDAVKNPGRESAVAAAMAQEAAGVARVTTELQRRESIARATVAEERQIAGSLDVSVAAFHRYEAAIKAATDALSRHKNVELYRAQIQSIRTSYQDESISPVVRVDQSAVNSRVMSSFSKDGRADMEAAIAANERLRTSAKMLLLELDPLTAATDRLNAEMAEYRAMADANLLTDAQLLAAQTRRGVQFQVEAENIKRIGNNVRLSRHEMANMSYQLNDIAVMTASGQAPFMMLMQQGMQLGMVLGPHGLQGGAKALGAGIIEFVTNPVNLAVVGFAALAGGAVWAYQKITDKTEVSSEKIQEQSRLVAALKDHYKALGVEARAASPDANVLEFKVKLNFELAKRQVTSEINSLWEQIRPLQAWERAEYGSALDAGLSSIGLGSSRYEFAAFTDVINEMRKSSQGGELDFENLERNILAVGDATPETVGKMFDMLGALRGIKEEADKAALALDLARGKSDLFGQSFVELVGARPKLQPLSSFIPDNRSKRDMLDETYRASMFQSQNEDQSAEATLNYKRALGSLNAELDKTIALQNLDLESIRAKTPEQKADIAYRRELVNAKNTSQGADETAIKASNAYNLALAQGNFALSEQTRQLRESSAIELAAIAAKSPAQKAEIAYMRERMNALNSGASLEEANTRAVIASGVAYQQSAYAIAEQNRARLQAANDNISQQKLELQLVGATAFERALSTANLQSYLDLQRQGVQNGLGFDEKQYDLLKKKNEEAARFIELQAESRLDNELKNEKRKLGMTTEDAEIFDKLISSGLRENSDGWDRLANKIREINGLKREFGYGFSQGLDEVTSRLRDFGSTGREVVTEFESSWSSMWTNFAKTGKLNFDDLLTTATDIAAKISYQFAMNGILNMLGGNTSLYGDTGGGFLSSLGGLLANANGNAFYGGNVSRFASGGAFTNSIVTRPTMFAYGGKFGQMGEAGPEAVMPLQRGSDGKLGVSASGGGGGSAPKVIIIDQRVNAPPIEQSRDGNGNLVQIIRDLVRDEVGSGVKQNMSSSYGIKKMNIVR